MPFAVFLPIHNDFIDAKGPEKVSIRRSGLWMDFSLHFNLRRVSLKIHGGSVSGFVRFHFDTTMCFHVGSIFALHTSSKRRLKLVPTICRLWGRCTPFRLWLSSSSRSRSSGSSNSSSSVNIICQHMLNFQMICQGFALSAFSLPLQLLFLLIGRN